MREVPSTRVNKEATGVSLEETIELLIDELRKAAEKRNIEFRLIITIPRSEYSFTYLNTLLLAYISIGKPKDIVGLDLAGNEEYPIPKNLGRMFKFAKEVEEKTINIYLEGYEKLTGKKLGE